MEWLGDLLGGAASIASGGLFGLLGSLVGVGAKWLQERQRQAWERQRQAWERQKWDHETRMLELQMQARAAETEQELAIVSQQGAWDGLGASQRADAGLTGSVHTWVNDVRALFRPVLTTGLVVLVYLLFRDLLAALGDGGSILGAVLAEAEVKDVIRYIVFSMVFAASTAIVWWFGDRAFAPPGMKSR